MEALIVVFEIVLLFVAGLIAVAINVDAAASIMIVTVVAVNVIVIGTAITIVKIGKIKKKKEEKEKTQKFIELVKSGEWPFPVADFYNICVSQNATKLSDKLHVQKMMLIADDILNKAHIPEYLKSNYISNEIVKQYFRDGKEQQRLAEEEEKRIEAEKYIIPQDTTLEKYDIEEINLHESLKNCLYADKRRAHLAGLREQAWKRVEEIRDAQNAAKDLSVAVMNSAHQEKTIDWAIAGGIADGLAGPAAGIMAATGAMKKNEEIKKRNAENQKAVNNLARQIWLSSLNNSSEELYLKEIKKYDEELNALKFKAVDDSVSTSELFGNLRIWKRKVEKDIYTGTRSFFSVYIKNNNSNRENSDLEMVVDGTIQVKVYCGSALVDDITVALPWDGIAHGSEKYVSVPMKKYMIGDDRKYKFKIEPNALWLIER